MKAWEELRGGKGTSGKLFLVKPLDLSRWLAGGSHVQHSVDSVNVRSGGRG